MIREHRARITWSAAQVARGLPDIAERTDPAWLAADPPGRTESWSLVCRFDGSPKAQGSPSLAWVRFLFPEAPADWLRPGTRLHLFERAADAYATVEILD